MNEGSGKRRMRCFRPKCTLFKANASSIRAPLPNTVQRKDKWSKINSIMEQTMQNIVMTVLDTPQSKTVS